MNRRLHSVLAVALIASAAVLLPNATASHDVNGTHDSVQENVTQMKNGIIETIATWIPFVILFTLLGVALAAIGIDWAGIMKKHGP